MKNMLRLWHPALLLATAFLLDPIRASGAPALFADDFDTDTAAQWDVFNTSGNGTPDFTVQFSYHYGTNKYTAENLLTGATVTSLIPPAPNSTAGTTRGLKITVNKNDDVADTAAVSLYPKGLSFRNNFALRFDMWINYNGGPGGGTGSTEFGTFGINHTGTQVNWQANETAGDGLWFAATGEGGAAQDYRSYEFDGFLSISLPALDAGLIAGNAGVAVFLERFPHPDYESAGSPGKHWVQGEVKQKDGMIIWKLNGYVVAERANATPFASGNIMIGYMDVFTSIADPKVDNFILYDNVRVVNLDLEPSVASVSVEATDADASEPGTNTGTFTVSRTEPTTSPLTVNFVLSGDAQAGLDYRTNTSSVTIPAGASSAAVAITPIDNLKGEPAETVNLTLVSGADYEMRLGVRGTVTIADDGDVTAVSLVATDTNIFESVSSDVGRVEIIRTGDTAGELTVTLTLGGTATNGVDYATFIESDLLSTFLKGQSLIIPIPAGSTNAAIIVTPINDSLIEGDETVVVSLAAGANYVLGVLTNATLLIRDDDRSGGTVVFSENFDVDHTANWTINLGPTDGVADFFFDYSMVGIPSAPNSAGGSTRGLKLQANVSSGVFGGLSVSPNGQNFSGDFRLRFDLWQNFNGPLPAGGSGSTQVTGAGLGTSGSRAQWAGGTQDSVWFATTGDGSSTVDYRAYSSAAGTGYTDASGVFVAGSGAGVRNNTHGYYAVFGGEAVPAAQLALFPNQTGVTTAGDQGFRWRDLVITKIGSHITWSIDGISIASVDASTVNLGGSNIHFNYFDINATVSADPDATSLLFGLIDNVRVESLATTPSEPPAIRSAQLLANNQIQINFTSSSGLASGFSLQSAASLGALISWKDETAAVISSPGPGQFNAVITREGDARFYRIKR